MSILPQLESDLIAAARCRSHPLEQPKSVRLRRAMLPWLRGARLAIAVTCAVLALATIALATTGVILTGSPVPPAQPQNPNVGNGTPAPGQSQLLPLRVPDPQGGLPWGMRIVGTTRGEVCVQVARIDETGRLGELGIDGAFHDDGRFHPLPQAPYPA